VEKADLTPGRYRHYKGGLYEVIGETFHTETQQKLVVYKALYGSEQFSEGTLWVRPKEMFEENLMIDGKPVPRFQKVAEVQVI